MVAVYYQINRFRKDVISLHNGALWASEVLQVRGKLERRESYLLSSSYLQETLEVTLIAIY
jgi:hypothetical protein